MAMVSLTRKNCKCAYIMMTMSKREKSSQKRETQETTKNRVPLTMGRTIQFTWDWDTDGPMDWLNTDSVGAA